MKYLIIPFILLFVGCRAIDQRSGHGYTLTISDTLKRIPVSNEVYPQTIAIQLFESGDTVRYLCYLNKGKNELLFFYFDSLKISHKISYASEGPEGIGKVVGFTIKTLDSVYITSKGRKVLYLTDRFGSIIQKLDYSNVSHQSMACYATTGNAVIISDSMLYLPRTPEGNWTMMSDNQVTSFNLCLSIRQKDAYTKVLPLCYPEATCETRSIQYKWCNGSGPLVFSFERDDNLYLTKNLNEWETISGESSLNKTTKALQTNPDPEEYLKFSIETPSYEGIIFDKYRDVYYRICYQGFKTGKNVNLMQLSLFKPRYSILILDSELKITGETLLPDNRFYFEEYFVGKEGLYISENNIFNDDYNEDFLTYRLLRLEKQ